MNGTRCCMAVMHVWKLSTTVLAYASHWISTMVRKRNLDRRGGSIVTRACRSGLVEYGSSPTCNLVGFIPSGETEHCAMRPAASAGDPGNHSSRPVGAVTDDGNNNTAVQLHSSVPTAHVGETKTDLQNSSAASTCPTNYTPLGRDTHGSMTRQQTNDACWLTTKRGFAATPRATQLLNKGAAVDVTCGQP